MATFNFQLGELPPEAQKVRAEIRDFLTRALGGTSGAMSRQNWNMMYGSAITTPTIMAT